MVVRDRLTEWLDVQVECFRVVCDLRLTHLAHNPFYGMGYAEVPDFRGAREAAKFFKHEQLGFIAHSCYGPATDDDDNEATKRLLLFARGLEVLQCRDAVARIGFKLDGFPLHRPNATFVKLPVNSHPQCCDHHKTRERVAAMLSGNCAPHDAPIWFFDVLDGEEDQTVHLAFRQMRKGRYYKAVMAGDVAAARYEDVADGDSTEDEQDITDSDDHLGNTTDEDGY
jgi:hypothetical protein